MMQWECINIEDKREQADNARGIRTNWGSRGEAYCAYGAPIRWNFFGEYGKKAYCACGTPTEFTGGFRCSG